RWRASANDHPFGPSALPALTMEKPWTATARPTSCDELNASGVSTRPSPSNVGSRLAVYVAWPVSADRVVPGSTASSPAHPASASSADPMRTDQALGEPTPSFVARS